MFFLHVKSITINYGRSKKTMDEAGKTMDNVPMYMPNGDQNLYRVVLQSVVNNDEMEKFELLHSLGSGSVLWKERLTENLDDGKYCEMAILVAGYTGNVEAFSMLLDFLIIIDMSIILDIVSGGHLPVIKILTEKRLLSIDQWTLTCFAEKGHFEAFKFYFDNYFDKEKKAVGRICLEYACDGCPQNLYPGHLNIIKYLVQQGADNFQEMFDVACSRDNSDLVDFLLSLSGATKLPWEKLFLTTCKYKCSIQLVHKIFSKIDGFKSKSVKTQSPSCVIVLKNYLNFYPSSSFSSARAQQALINS